MVNSKDKDFNYFLKLRVAKRGPEAQLLMLFVLSVSDKDFM